MTDQAKTATPQALDAQTARQLCGDVPDATVTAILALGASVADLELALAWGAGESDVMGEERLPLTGPAAEIYEILVAEEEFGDER